MVSGDVIDFTHFISRLPETPNKTPGSSMDVSKSGELMAESRHSPPALAGGQPRNHGGTGILHNGFHVSEINIHQTMQRD